ncbi:hypothetical protein Scep_011864 [Stephania cephalantha]|uniref:Rrn7/TAF1B C-terminal cyclin domain-containing protein n=1 Tax=Stephania cephalantha TaxID=152367 RepID=A0AAP0JDW9_9MAGN
MSSLVCVCGSTDISVDAGFYYCDHCGAQLEDIVDTGVDAEDLEGGALYSQTHRRAAAFSTVKSEPLTLLSQPSPQISQPAHADAPSEPQDFGAAAGIRVGDLTAEDYSSEIRVRYAMGIQLMIEYQCEALVEKFRVNPLICGLAGAFWMRYLAATRVFGDEWANVIFEESEVQKEGVEKVSKIRAKYSAEPHNIHGQRAVVMWFRSLRKKIPPSTSLGIAFLACHVAREAILPTDILKWSLEGKLPYLTAFINIDKTFGGPSRACPFSSSFMFRPFRVIGSKELVSLAGSIAQCIGLELPPVNVYAITLRYLKQLSLPVQKILPHAIRIYRWSMAPDLWISANPHRLQPHVCVMSIVIVAIRILYNINGFGKWEKSLSNSSNGLRKENMVDKKFSSGNLNGRRETADAGKSFESDTMKLLCDLKSTYEKMCDTPEYSKNLYTYLKYCDDVIFGGLTSPLEDNTEEKIKEELWKFYENKMDEAGTVRGGSFSEKRKRENCFRTPSLGNKKCRKDVASASLSHETHSMCNSDGGGRSRSISEEQNQGIGESNSAENLKDEAIKHMVLDMEENGFYYIPPRVNIKRLDYLHYVRKNDAGSRDYVAHADYYILLRACALVVQVDVQKMHAAVLNFEKRLAWTESLIDRTLQMKPPEPSSNSSEHKEPECPAQYMDDSVDCEDLDYEFLRTFHGLA